MNIKDEGLIIYVKIISDNNLFIKLLSNNNGLRLGIVYGGNTKKNKNIYQIGNFVNFNLLQKNENSVSIINAEIIKPLLSTFFNDKYKLYGVLTLCSLITSRI